jgi:excisionase family DNA binding protein
MSEAEALLTTRQLQNLLKVDRITIYRMLSAGHLPGFKLGGQWRFSRDSIERWLQEQRACAPLPKHPVRSGNQGPAADALPLPCLRAIQDLFADALGVATVITAADGSPLTPIAHSCQFCTLILDRPAGQERCAASWRAAALNPGQIPHLVTCHVGLAYVWGRIEVRGRCLAALHAGQFLTAAPDVGAWSARLQKLSAETGVGLRALQEALADVPILDESRRQQIPRLLQQFASTLSEIGEDRLELLGRLERIAELSTGALDLERRI